MTSRWDYDILSYHNSSVEVHSRRNLTVNPYISCQSYVKGLKRSIGPYQLYSLVGFRFPVSRKQLAET